MASIYTHNRFGEELLKKPMEELRPFVHSPLFLFGNQGPDLFFFHLSLKINGRNPGDFIHERPHKDYIEKNKDLLRSLDPKGETFAYFLGSLCHFILDAHIHPVVDALETKTYTHMDIESELDRYFMERDGRDPFTFHLDRLLPSPNLAESITPLYTAYGVTDGDVKKSIQNFRRIKKIFHSESLRKEKFLLKLLSLLGKEKYRGLIIRQKPFQEAALSNPKLGLAYGTALSRAPGLLKNALAFIYAEEPLDPFFQKNYNGRSVL